MDAVREVDSLIEMVRALLCNPGQPRFTTPECREFQGEAYNEYLAVLSTPDIKIGTHRCDGCLSVAF